VTHVKAPGFEVAVYEIIGDPPFELGAFQLTVAEIIPAVATIFVGAPGDMAGITEAETPAVPVPN
jgi:hypothetical protein